MRNLTAKINMIFTKIFRASFALLLVGMVTSQFAFAANTQKPPIKKAYIVKGNPATVQTKASVLAAKPQITPEIQKVADALRLLKSGDSLKAIIAIFEMIKKPGFESHRAQLRYYLGLALIEQKLYQTAAFQFVDVIRSENNSYTRQAIEKLAQVADHLGDDSLLDYAINKVQLDQVPASQRDMVFYRLGEAKLKNQDFEVAAQAFGKVAPKSKYWNQALFKKGLAELESKNTDQAARTFTALIRDREKLPVTDTNRVAAEIALARTYYQAKKWDAAIEVYRRIPRDHELWHDALFEMSWAQLQSGRFRSVLSNVQSLHSPFYDDFYIPESLLLRSIVYLYICQYDEMEKVLEQFNKKYGFVRSSIRTFVEATNDMGAIYSEIEKADAARRSGNRDGLRLPLLVSRSVLEEGEVKKGMKYLAVLKKEKDRLETQSGIAKTAIGRYGLQIVNKRMANTKTAIGALAKSRLIQMQNELSDLFEQASFARYEMINGKKEQLKKKISGKLVQRDASSEEARDFAVQNGYEYWPFQGEYWLDEIGNYQYMGQQSCE